MSSSSTSPSALPHSADALREQAQNKIREMGETYLCHPNNFVKRLTAFSPAQVKYTNSTPWPIKK